MSKTGDLAVSALIGDEVVTIVPQATASEVCDLLTANDIGAVAVVEGARTIGIVSERDIVHLLAERKDVAVVTAGDIANTKLVWADGSAAVADVAELMMERFVRHVLIEEDAQLAGIVSARDLLGCYAAEDIELP